MTDDLARYYERELELLRGLAAEFAGQHEKVAARLALGTGDSKDPHVERLLQGVSFLTARIHKRLDDDFPELTEALLDVICPHALQQVPSMTIVEMAFDRAHAAVDQPHPVPRGTIIETEPVDDEQCQYRTIFDVPVYPVQVVDVTLSGPPFGLPNVPRGTRSVLRIVIETLAERVTIDGLALGRLRFHLADAGAPRTAFQLYEWIFSRCLGVSIAGEAAAKGSSLLPAGCLWPVGFDDGEASLPIDGRSLPGYRLLTEFFALPEKFLFFDLDMGEVAKRCAGRRLEISILLSGSDRALEQSVGRETVRLGCTPAVNLFEMRLEAVKIDGRKADIPLTPSSRHPKAFEVRSVKQVRLLGQRGVSRTVRPLNSGGAGGFRGDSVAETGLWWTATRKQRSIPRPDSTQDVASEVWMTIVDESGGPASLIDQTLEVEAECVNRNLPERLPYTAGRPTLRLRKGNGPLKAIRCVSRPTSTLRPEGGRGIAWRLISHLSLNHLSLVEGTGTDAAAALREVLGLHILSRTEHARQKRAWLEGILRVSSSPDTARVPGGRGGICRGVKVRLELDEDRYDGAAYLFACVIDRFLGGWVSINSFTRLVVALQQRSNLGEEWKWPPRAGDRRLS
jgi:type VI secretion system protein ImpG